MKAIAQAREKLLAVPVGANAVQLLAHQPAGWISLAIPGLRQEKRRRFRFPVAVLRWHRQTGTDTSFFGIESVAAICHAIESRTQEDGRPPTTAEVTSLRNAWNQVKALAAKMGIDPDQASAVLAQYLPKVVDKLTPQGAIDPNANHQADLAGLIPALLQSFGRGGTGAAT